jgi:hypothetical protein
LQPTRESSSRDFGVDVRARPGNQVDTSFGGSFEELFIAEDAFC